MELLKVFIMIFFVTHWTACLFYLVGNTKNNSGDFLTWIDLVDPNERLTTWQFYVQSAYWVATTITTIGYGDFYAVSDEEKCVAIFVMMVACGVFPYLVGTMSTLFDSQDAQAKELKDKILHIDQFLKANKISLKMRARIRRYLLLVAESKSENKMEIDEVLELLNENLRLELVCTINLKMLRTQILGSFDELFISQIIFVLKQQTFGVNDIIFRENYEGNTWYFIMNGNANLIHYESKTYITELGMSSTFGEIAFFSQQMRKVTVKSTSYTEVLVMERENFLEFAKKGKGEAFSIYQEIQNNINEKKDLTLLGMECYLCQFVGHISIDCHNFDQIKGNLTQEYLEKMKELEKQQRKQNELKSLQSYVGQNLEFEQSQKQDDTSVRLQSYNQKRRKSQIEEERHSQHIIEMVKNKLQLETPNEERVEGFDPSKGEFYYMKLNAQKLKLEEEEKQEQ